MKINHHQKSGGANNLINLHSTNQYSEPITPSLYVFNAAALTKPHAIEHLTADFISYNTDVAIISETHFKTKHADSIMGINNYTFYRRDRTGRRGGGVAIYVRENLISSVWTPRVISSTPFELLWIRVNCVFVAALYHPPKPLYKTQDLQDHMENCMAEILNCFPSTKKTSAQDIWKAVRRLTGRKQQSGIIEKITADILKDHYANTSTDHTYRAPPRIATVNSRDTNYFNERSMFNILDKLRPTATGLDELPAWFLRLGAPAFAKPLARLFNLSLAESVVPTQWKQSRIYPIPKIPSPQQPSDFRPISITPVLSRVFEKALVKQFIYLRWTWPSGQRTRLVTERLRVRVHARSFRCQCL
jgi:hypothetical protein